MARILVYEPLEMLTGFYEADLQDERGHELITSNDQEQAIFILETETGAQIDLVLTGHNQKRPEVYGPFIQAALASTVAHIIINGDRYRFSSDPRIRHINSTGLDVSNAVENILGQQETDEMAKD